MRRVLKIRIPNMVQKFNLCRNSALNAPQLFHVFYLKVEINKYGEIHMLRDSRQLLLYFTSKRRITRRTKRLRGMNDKVF